MNTKRLAADAVLTAAALALVLLEAQIPPIAPVPGIKLGLANVVTLVAIYAVGRRDAGVILLLRVCLGGVFAGTVTAFLFSAAGGLCSFAVMCLLSRPFRGGRVWAVSVFGALAHNTGQLAAASVLMRTARVFYYFPALVLSAVVTGVFTGLCAQYAAKTIKIQYPRK